MWQAFLAVFVMAAFAGCERTAPRNAGPPQKITVAYTYQPESALVHVALAKRYFADEGLDVQTSMHTYGKLALQAVLDNKADFATVAETPVMFSVLKGEKIFVIANILTSSTNNAIVARNDAGIVAAADLKGKRIGFTPGTTSDFFLDSLLAANGFTRKDILPIALKPEEMQDAMVARKVDAVSTWNYPLTQIKRQLGSGASIFYDREIYTEAFNMAARQEFVQKNPQVVQRFLRALIKAEAFVAKHADESQDIMAAATKIDKSLIHDVWSAFDFHVGLDQILLITLEDETRWAIKNQLTGQTVMPDYASYIHFDSLRAVKPEAVRVSR